MNPMNTINITMSVHGDQLVDIPMDFRMVELPVHAESLVGHGSSKGMRQHLGDPY